MGNSLLKSLDRPACWKRLQARLIGVQVAISILALLGVWLAARWLIARTGPNASLQGILPFVLIPVFLVQVGFLIWKTALQRSWAYRAAYANYLLCPQCGYDVEAIAKSPAGDISADPKCPECGKTFDPSEASRLWRNCFEDGHSKP